MTTYALIIQIDEQDPAKRCDECIFNNHPLVGRACCSMLDADYENTSAETVKDCPLINMDILKRQLIDTMYQGVKKANEEMEKARQEFEIEILYGRGYMNYRKNQADPVGILDGLMPKDTIEKALERSREYWAKEGEKK